MLLDGKVALITGASKGIGAVSARAFAAAGAAVVLAARNAGALDGLAEEINAQGGRALAVPTDVTDEASVARLVDAATGHFGALHVAFNNAGGIGDAGPNKAPLDEKSTADFDAVIDVNLRATYFCLKYEVRAMLAAGGGAIVNMSSGAGLTGSVPGISPYVAAKHGLQGLTKTAALDYAAQGIRINAVAPGPILTDILSSGPPEYRQAAAAAVPMQRVGLPEEVAAAAIWLCSDQASYITGATLPIDGGQLAGRI